MLTIPELAKLTGASKRTIDYWVRRGYIDCIGNPTPGSGVTRYFDDAVVEKVKVLNNLSSLINKGNDQSEIILFRLVADNYESGELDIAGFRLTWSVNARPDGDPT